MKKIFRWLSIYLVSAGIIIFGVWVYSNWLESKIANIDVNRVDVSMYGWNMRDHGKILIKKCIANDDLLLVGSSELSSLVPQNPRKFFPNNKFHHRVIPVGRACAQSLINAMRVASWQRNCGLDRFGIVISLQWFFNDDIDDGGTAANFSELQFYDFMFSDRYSKQQKKYVVSRFSKLLRRESICACPCFYAKAYSIDEKLAYLLNPFYYGRYYFLKLKEKHDVYKELKERENIQYVLSDIDWDDEEKKAYKEGKEACSNNNLFLENVYYDRHIKNTLAERKNANSTVRLMDSKEHEDFDFFLNICNQLNLRPYIILMSVNGWDYDYTGLTRDKRYQLYDSLIRRIKNYGFAYLDLRDKEYEPYFYTDIMHLGWKGWLYCDKEISNYFK